MARARKPADEPAGVPPWMATFSDLVTLLLTFFVMLMAMASFEDSHRVTALLRSLHEQLGADGFEPDLMGPGDGEFMSPTVSADVSLSPLLARLAAAFRDHLSQAVVTTDFREDELRLTFPDSTFFQPGSDVVHPTGYATLDRLADLLATEDSVRVEVLGDARPGESTDRRTLAIARAVAVIERLRRGVPGERLTTGAYMNAPDDPTDKAARRAQRIGLVVRTGTVQGRAAVQGPKGAIDAGR